MLYQQNQSYRKYFPIFFKNLFFEHFDFFLFYFIYFLSSVVRIMQIVCVFRRHYQQCRQRFFFLQNECLSHTRSLCKTFYSLAKEKCSRSTCSAGDEKCTGKKFVTIRRVCIKLTSANIYTFNMYVGQRVACIKCVTRVYCQLTTSTMINIVTNVLRIVYTLPGIHIGRRD